MLHKMNEEEYKEFIKSMMITEMANYIKAFRLEYKCTIPAVATMFSKVYSSGMFVNPDSESDGNILCELARKHLKYSVKRWNLESEVDS